MKSLLLFPLVIIFSIFFLSCEQKMSDPISSDDSNNSGTQILAKTQWFTSPTKTWDCASYCPPGTCYACYYSCNLTYTFSYYTIQNYVFTFDYNRTGPIIHVKVNGLLIGTVFEYDQNQYEHWTGWFPFTYNGKNMKVQFYIMYFTIKNNCTGNWDPRWEPRFLKVMVEEKYVDPPTNFTVTPTMHNNYNQVVSLSWTPSTDTDVTGYEIYRGRYYLVNGQLNWTGYYLFKTFTTRTSSSWQDSPVWGTVGRNPGIGYWYKIRSVSSTLGLVSNFRGPGMCYLEAYDAILP